MNTATRLFDEVVRASGLVDLIAPFAISRLLVAAGVPDPRNVSREELVRALPTLERGLETYLRQDELEQARAALRGLAG